MKIIIAPDSFKESMTANEVCNCIEKAIKKVNNSHECVKIPMSDGGEGTVQSLVDATGGKLYDAIVHDPLNRKVKAKFGVLGDNTTAVIEMAEASGLHLVNSDERNPLLTSTYGTGELIKAALDKDISKIIIGIGGSATNDGGVGMLTALGGEFLDDNNKEISLGGGGLKGLKKINLDNFDKRMEKVTIEVACDVNNTLTGENGASNVFGRQKGATEEMIKILDNNLRHYANIVREQFNIDIENVNGTGAAGGLGAALIGFCGAKLETGIEIVIRYTELEKYIKDADLVFTGEGGIDFQTKFGKTPYGVAKVAKKYNKPVICIAGRVGEGIEELYEHGFTSILGIMDGVTTIDNALANGSKNIERTISNIMRIIESKIQ